MGAQVITFGKREVLVGSLKDMSKVLVSGPFVALVSASYPDEIDEIVGIAGDLLARGCKEFCCLGSQAEQLNDRLDYFLEDAGALGVVTTWYEDSVEGCEYFLFAAGAQRLYLVALISQSVDLISLLGFVDQAD